MGGEGSIMGMIVSLRNNNKLLRKTNPFQRNRSFGKLRDDYIKYSYPKGKVESKSISKHELEEIRKRVILENKRENLKIIIFTSIALLVIVGVASAIFIHFRNNNQLLQQRILKQNTEQYLDYISDGDKWLEKKRWNKAIFQYLLAKKIFPNEYNVNYRLVLAYGNNCKFELIGCKPGLDLLNKLKNQFPEKSELINVQHMFNSN